MEDFLAYLGKIFIRDEKDFYNYKSGPAIYKFFNQKYGFNDSYYEDDQKPSRHIMIKNRLIILYNGSRLNDFISYILSPQYLYIEEPSLTNEQLAEKALLILNDLNEFLYPRKMIINHINGKYQISKIDDTLEIIGSGGFANVYRDKSKNKIVIKKLQDDFYINKGIVSRFKREFEIMKKLSNINGVLKVYDFDNKKLEYTMEEAETDLYDFIVKNPLQENAKIIIIKSIFDIMVQVHDRDICHRDLSPNNVLIMQGQIKISDFGLGKDFSVIHSHQSMNTNGMGQYVYCDPRQFMKLKEGDKKSDIYSMGRLINFIMTGNPLNSDHKFKIISERSTTENENYRYQTMRKMSESFDELVKLINEGNIITKGIDNIENEIYDDSVIYYLDSLNSNQIYKGLQNEKFRNSFERFLKFDCTRNCIHDKASILLEECQNYWSKSFESYDGVGNFAIKIIENTGNDMYLRYEFIPVLNYVMSVNRYNILGRVKTMVDNGLELELVNQLNNLYENY